MHTILLLVACNDLNEVSYSKEAIEMKWISPRKAVIEPELNTMEVTE